MPCPASLHRLVIAGGALAVLAGCSSVNRVATNRISDALAGNGTVFASDGDPELVRDAAPFSLKLMESVLAENPKHQRLLTAASSGFAGYAYAFVQQDADEREDTDIAAAMAGRVRARGLYLRARDYGLRGLDVAHPGLTTALRSNPRGALAQCRREDVPLLYWTAASWGGAVAATKDDPQLIADLPMVSALIDRALELDEAYDEGAIHTFLITYEMSRHDSKGKPAELAQRHFDRAVELSHGRQASPYVALAESVYIQQQDRAGFDQRLHEALAIDPNAAPERRLVNMVMQRRARWLLDRIDELFLPEEKSPGPTSP
ncbi:MAG TPA: TRAP transporter TatT component family protein [Candidatus Didemnitutus sp.]|nr:TRAP transporter TatT component family protein [Candidatus Didemnitutus sp.]